MDKSALRREMDLLPWGNDSHALPGAKLWGSLEISTWAGFGGQDDNPWSWPQSWQDKAGHTAPAAVHATFLKEASRLTRRPGARSRLSCGRQSSSWTTIWGPRTAPRCLLKWLLACWPQPASEVYLWFPLPGTFGLSYLGLQATIFTRFLLGSFVKTKQTQKKTARLQLFLQIHHDPDCSKQLAGKQGGAYSQGRLFFVQMLANIV